VRQPEQLRPPHALVELGWSDLKDERNDAARLKIQSVPEPILITTEGTILAGFWRWHLALVENREEIHCIEYPLKEEESLQFILAYHQPRRGWNDFVRIRLALTLEPHFRQRALENMRAGGKCKGSTNLSEADRMDVRREVAKAAGTGTGNVDKVKAILHSAHPNINAALLNGLLTIHRAWQWRSLPKLQQKAEFARYEEERIQRKILRDCLGRAPNISPDPAQAIEALQKLEARQPGSIAVRITRSRRTVVILGQDLLEAFDAQKELNCHA